MTFVMLTRPHPSSAVQRSGAPMSTAPFTKSALAMAGLGTAWYIYMKNPAIADLVKAKTQPLYTILDRKYWMDELFQFLFAGGSRGIGKLLWKGGDQRLIDGVLINGSARGVGWIAGIARQMQTGYLYHYAIAMILGLLGLLIWFVNA